MVPAGGPGGSCGALTQWVLQSCWARYLAGNNSQQMLPMVALHILLCFCSMR